MTRDLYQSLFYFLLLQHCLHLSFSVTFFVLIFCTTASTIHLYLSYSYFLFLCAFNTVYCFIYPLLLLLFSSFLFLLFYSTTAFYVIFSLLFLFISLRHFTSYFLSYFSLPQHIPLHIYLSSSFFFSFFSTTVLYPRSMDRHKIRSLPRTIRPSYGIFKIDTPHTHNISRWSPHGWCV